MRRRAGLRRRAARLEARWDAWQVARRAGHPPENFRIIPYVGHGSGSTAVIGGRVLDNPAPTVAAEGEGIWAAARRTFTRFNTVELPGVPLRLRVGDHETDTETDDEGYFHLRLETDLSSARAGWLEGEVGLTGPYRGLDDGYQVGFSIRVPTPDARFGVISDVDDTIVHTGTRSSLSAIRNTVMGSALTRTPVAGAAELCRGLAVGKSGPDENPFFYLSSSPWNLYGLLAAFLEHQQFPLGPLLLRDLLGGEAEHTNYSHKTEQIDEILELHPQLGFVLLGDSAEDDPGIYMDAIGRHPDRIIAVYIRDVGRHRHLEALRQTDVPFLVAADWGQAAEHASGLGLIRRP